MGITKPVIDFLQTLPHTHRSHSATVQDIISNCSWSIPNGLISNCPTLAEEIDKVTIPIFNYEDKLVWQKSISGSLTLK